MSPYEFDISRADNARDLNHLWNEVETDQTLDAPEKTALLHRIRDKLSVLNRRTLPTRVRN